MQVCLQNLNLCGGLLPLYINIPLYIPLYIFTVIYTVIYKLGMLGADLICGRWSAGVSAPLPRLETALARVHLLYV